MVWSCVTKCQDFLVKGFSDFPFINSISLIWLLLTETFSLHSDQGISDALRVEVGDSFLLSRPAASLRIIFKFHWVLSLELSCSVLVF